MVQQFINDPTQMDTEVVIKQLMVLPKHLPEENWEKPWQNISQDS